MELYEKIEKIRKEKNISKTQLSKETNISRNNINGICNGTHVKNFSLRVVLKIARSFDMDIYELIKDTEYDLKNL